MLLNRQEVLSYFDAPSPEILEKWCDSYNYQGVFPTQDSQQEDMPSDYVLATALYYAQNKYPDAERIDICSFAGLVAYLVTGWYGGFGTDQYTKERIAENVVTALAGGIPPKPGTIITRIPEKPEADTKNILQFLETFYFVDPVKAIDALFEHLDRERIAQVMLALATTQAEYYELAKTADAFLKKKTNISSLRKAVKALNVFYH